MSNDSKGKVTLTEEQASRAAETLLNAWLRGDDDNPIIKKTNEKDKTSK